MPYPSPDDPDYCPGSRQLIANYDPLKHWHRCASCGRLIVAMGKTGRFFPHVKNKKRARRRDDVQEGLTAHGMNHRNLARVGVDPADAPIIGFEEYREQLQEFHEYRNKIIRNKETK